METAEPPRPGRLEGLACLIVGGTGGIGLAASRRFLAEGARLVVAGEPAAAGIVDREGLARLGPIHERVVDLTSESSVMELFAASSDALGGDSTSFFTSPGSVVAGSGTGPCTSAASRVGSGCWRSMPGASS